jgi:DNA polymerase I-like protein with 3'-5' exonuclease and polymerase domains
MKRKDFDDKVTKEMIEYSAKDVQLLPIIYRLQKAKLFNENLMRISYLEFEVCKIVADIELSGIYIDVNSWQAIINNNVEQKEKTQQEIFELIARPQASNTMFGTDQINLNSTKIIIQAFHNLGIELTSTKESDLLQVNHPLAKLILEYRKFEKQLSSFGESFLSLVRKETNRIHPSFQQIGADTGRFSCNKPNIQQIPAEEIYRKCFSAPPGRKIIACDYSQQELRVLASLSGDPKFIKFYEDGVDLHSATASMMFNIPIEKVEKETHRKIAKTINFGLAYGQGAKKLGLTIGVDEDEALKMIDKYFSQFSYIRDWLDGAAKEAQTLGYSKTLMGRKRYYNLPEKENPEYKQLMSAFGRRGKNTPIQGSGADMIKLALTKIIKRFKSEKLDCFLTSIVHDEIVAEASCNDAEKAGEIIRECMVEAGKELAPNVPILAEVGIGDYWKH